LFSGQSCLQLFRVGWSWLRAVNSRSELLRAVQSCSELFRVGQSCPKLLVCVIVVKLLTCYSIVELFNFSFLQLFCCSIVYIDTYLLER
jgi:hypothetical protein